MAQDKHPMQVSLFASLLIPGWTEFYFPDMPGIWTSRFAWNRDGLEGREKMADN
jgi:hypothetical protein